MIKDDFTEDEWFEARLRSGTEIYDIARAKHRRVGFLTIEGTEYIENGFNVGDKTYIVVRYNEILMKTIVYIYNIWFNHVSMIKLTEGLTINDIKVVYDKKTETFDVRLR